MTTTTMSETPNLPAVRRPSIDVPLRPEFVPPATWLAALVLERLAVGGDAAESRRTALGWVLRPSEVERLVSDRNVNADDELVQIAVELVTGRRL